MKKIIVFMLALVMLVALTACDNTATPYESLTPSPSKVPESSQETEMVTSDPEGGNKITPQESAPSSETTEPEKDCVEINFGEQISLDFVEITIEGASSGDEIRPDNPQSVYRYMSDNEGEKYVYLYGTIKNISGNQYEFADNMYAHMTFDDKYNYSANITADEDGGFSYIYAYLDPLKSEKFYIIASIPDELADQYAQIKVKLGFAENFDGAYNIQENECDYLYSVTVSR